MMDRAIPMPRKSGAKIINLEQVCIAIPQNEIGEPLFLKAPQFDGTAIPAC
jgi:hypothetical protein